MSVESDKFNANVANLGAQTTQVKEYVAKIQGDLVVAVQATVDAIAAGATDKELADAVRAGMPAVEQVITDLDLITPDGTPVLETASRKRR